jgi:hypothetical protein
MSRARWFWLGVPLLGGTGKKVGEGGSAGAELRAGHQQAGEALADPDLMMLPVKDGQTK